MKHVIRILLSGAVVLCLGASTVSAQTMGQPEEFSAGAVDVNRGLAGQIQINIDRWSTRAERETLVGALTSKGPDELLKVLQDSHSVGRIRTPDTIGYDLRYAQQRPAPDGGRDIVIVTDRPISFWEATNRPRSIEYPFTLIQMHIKPDGIGEGKLALATRITSDPDTKEIEIEDYQNQPVNLVDVKSMTKKPNEHH